MIAQRIKCESQKNFHLIKKNTIESYYRISEKHIDITNRYYIYFEEDRFREDFTKVIRQLYKDSIKNLIECTQRVVLLTDKQDKNNSS